MLCKKCGKAILDGSKFCPYCGENVEIEPPEKPAMNNLYPYGACGRCGGPLESDDSHYICKKCLSSQRKYEKSPPENSPTYEPIQAEKKKHGCLISALVCVGLVVIIEISSYSTQSNPTATNEILSSSVESSSVSSTVPLSVRQENILSAFNNTIKWDVEGIIKRKLKHPDTATVIHDTSQLTVNNAIFTDRGSVSYTNANGKSAKEDYTVSVIATDKVYYTLYMQLGKTVFEDSIKGVNSLGIATAYGKQIFNVPDGNFIFEDTDGTIILITNNEKQKMSMSEYNKIKTNMTYAQVTEIVGSYGEEQARTNISDYEDVIIAWEGIGSIGSNANVTFQNGKVIAKAQFGLQ